MQYSLVEFDFHQEAPRNHSFPDHVGFLEQPWFQELAGTVVHIIDSHSDARTGYLQWDSRPSTNNCCPPSEVRFYQAYYIANTDMSLDRF